MHYLALIRIAIGMMFIISGFSKLIAPLENFAVVIESYDIIHGRIVDLVVWTFPWVELIGGAFLLTGIWLRQSLLAMWMSTTVFLILISSAIIRGLPVTECGCFGEMISFSLPKMLLVDTVLWITFGFMTFRLKSVSYLGLDRYLG